MSITALQFSQGFSSVNAPDVVTEFDKALNNINILAPQGVLQIDAFAFDYKADDTVDLTAVITDHWLEDNSAAQDHIGLQPAIVTLSGFISELSMSGSTFKQLSTIIAGVENSLSQVGAYLGKYTPGVTDKLLTAITQVQNVVIQAEQALARGAQILNILRGGPDTTKQQRAYAQLSALWEARVVFTIYTPFRVFDNMAIQSIKAVQGKTSRTVSDFVVTMKQLKFSSPLIDPSATFGGWAAGDNTAQSSNGGTAGTAAQTPTSAFKALAAP